MKDRIYKILPNFFQNLLISLFNFIAYKGRYGAKYQSYLSTFVSNEKLELTDLKKIQEKRFNEFLSKAIKDSKYYSTYSLVTLADIEKLPIINKEDLRKNISNVFTISKESGIVSKTGGTTGKSLEIIFTKDNMQERFAMLDAFRGKFGYKLGEKTAWFSGKNLLTARDISKNRFWKTDYFNAVRYYSTFHIKDDYLKYYIKDLNSFQPEYFVGFPSTILEIAKFGLKHNIPFEGNSIKAIFPTAETITSEMRSIIESYFKCKLYNQYASSEGAPFIIECEKGNLHLELQSGVFEVLDAGNKYCKKGRLIITSFTTDGTPLIRYDIGDSIELQSDDITCTCSNKNPLVKEILGREDDFLYSPENGKINLGNVSNTLKDTIGIIKFQAIQNELNTITILLVIDKMLYDHKVEEKFIKNWRDRIGEKMVFNIQYVDEISVETSGKYRLIKNNIKNLIK